MGQLQRTPGTAPAALSQDPPWLRRRERSSLVKSRMREICTSGSVRDGDGNVPIYSADVVQRVRSIDQHLGAQLLARAAHELDGRGFEARNGDLGEIVRLLQLVLGGIEAQRNDRIGETRRNDLQIRLDEALAGELDGAQHRAQSRSGRSPSAR